MNRSRPQNNFLENRIDKNQILYTKQRNYCLSSGKIQKELYFKLKWKGHIFDKSLEDCKTITDKVNLRDKINLSEDNQIIKSKFRKVDTLNNFFSNIKNLKKSI